MQQHNEIEFSETDQPGFVIHPQTGQTVMQLSTFLIANGPEALQQYEGTTLVLPEFQGGQLFQLVQTFIIEQDQNPVVAGAGPIPNQALIQINLIDNSGPATILTPLTIYFNVIDNRRDYMWQLLYRFQLYEGHQSKLTDTVPSGLSPLPIADTIVNPDGNSNANKNQQKSRNHSDKKEVNGTQLDGSFIFKMNKGEQRSLFEKMN